MITGHVPSGYILGKSLRLSTPLLMWVAMTGAVFPDFDLIWFYLVDNRAIHHHRYWVHAPGFWIMASVIALPVLWLLQRKLVVVWLVFVAGTMLHVLLDSIAGGIMWLWPYSGDLMSLVTVQPTHSHFVLSFMSHWTFLLEIALWVIAGAIYLVGKIRSRRNG